MADTGNLQDSLCDMMEQGVPMGVGFRERRGTGEPDGQVFQGLPLQREAGEQECSWQGKWAAKRFGLVLRWENRA